MLRRQILWVIVTIILGSTLAAVPARAYDYFTAHQDNVGEFLRILESAHVNTFSKWLSQGRTEIIIADIDYTLERFPNHPQALQQVSMIAQMKKKTQWAIGHFERAVSQYPQHALTRAQYGLFLVSIGSVDDGIKLFKQSIEMDPKLAAGHAGLAHAYAKKGDLPQAREAAQKARELGFTGKLPDGL